METTSPIATLVLGLLLGIVAIALYVNREPSSKLLCRLLPGNTRALRESLVGLLESKIEVFTELHGIPQGPDIAKMVIRENNPSQFQDEDIYVRAYRELIYVTNFEIEIIEPLNQRLARKGIEVYQCYLTRTGDTVNLVLEVRTCVKQ